MYGIFSEKGLIGFSSAIVSGMDYVLIPEDQRDLRMYEWRGTKDTGGMVRKSLEIRTSEECYHKIAKEYPPAVTMALLIRQLWKLLKDPALEHRQMSEFMEMAECFQEAAEAKKANETYAKGS